MPLCYNFPRLQLFMFDLSLGLLNISELLQLQQLHAQTLTHDTFPFLSVVTKTEDQYHACYAPKNRCRDHCTLDSETVKIHKASHNITQLCQVWNARILMDFVDSIPVYSVYCTERVHTQKDPNSMPYRCDLVWPGVRSGAGGCGRSATHAFGAVCPRGRTVWGRPKSSGGRVETLRKQL